MQNLNSKIGANKKAEEHEAWRHAERRRGKEEQTLKQWKALHAKMTRERAMKASAARSKAEAEKQAQAEAARAAEVVRKAREARNDRFKPATPLHNSSRATAHYRSTCEHDKLWPKLQGSHLCKGATVKVSLIER